jgi:hypothetical protein
VKVARCHDVIGPLTHKVGELVREAWKSQVGKSAGRMTVRSLVGQEAAYCQQERNSVEGVHMSSQGHLRVRGQWAWDSSICTDPQRRIRLEWGRLRKVRTSVVQTSLGRTW